MPDYSEPPVREFADRGVLWLLESPQNLHDVVRMLSTEIADRLDFSRAERQNRSFVPDDLHKQEADLLYRVPFVVEQRSVWIYVLLEHQSSPDRTIGLRILSYIVQIWQTQVRGWQDEKVPVSKWKLHPVLPLVFYTGKRKWKSPISLAAMMEDAPLLDAFVPKWETLFLNLQATPSETFKEFGLPIAQAFLAMQSVDEPADVLARTLHEAAAALDALPESELAAWKRIMMFFYHLVRNKRPVEEQDALFEEMDRAVAHHRVALEETNMTGAQALIKQGLDLGRQEGLQQGLQKGLQQGLQKGREEGREVGREEGREELLLEQLQFKFGPLAASTEDKVRMMAPEQLMTVAKLLIKADSLEELGL